MTMAIARREPNYYMAGFAAGFYGSPNDGFRMRSMRGEAAMAPLSITATDSLADAMHKTQGLEFGRTDCALPMLDALEKKIPVDVFVILTDSEWWRNSICVARSNGWSTARRNLDSPSAALWFRAEATW